MKTIIASAFLLLSTHSFAASSIDQQIDSAIEESNMAQDLYFDAGCRTRAQHEYANCHLLMAHWASAEKRKSYLLNTKARTEGFRMWRVEENKAR